MTSNTIETMFSPVDVKLSYISDVTEIKIWLAHEVTCAENRLATLIGYCCGISVLM